ncbi:hypothetical protein, partial [Vibrio parahaemolyticus]|uniref:hypothetical protein n=1 Tax=Vibrio parahaemolyticus TaxID=670 RepID=UPI00111BD5D2
MKKYIAPLLLTVVCASGFVGGILFEANRINNVKMYTKETEARFNTVLMYINQYHSTNGMYPENIDGINYGYIGSNINYEKRENGFLLNAEF